MKNGTLTVAKLRNVPVATRALDTGRIEAFPVSKVWKSENAPSESNTATMKMPTKSKTT